MPRLHLALPWTDVLGADSALGCPACLHPSTRAQRCLSESCLSLLATLPELLTPQRAEAEEKNPSLFVSLQLLPPYSQPCNIKIMKEKVPQVDTPAQHKLGEIRLSTWDYPALFVTGDTQWSAFSPQTIKVLIFSCRKDLGVVVARQMIPFINRLM